jgi:hypothetical protein
MNFPGESFLEIKIEGFWQGMLNIDKSRGIEFEDNSLRDGGFCKILDMFEEGNTSKSLQKKL